MANCTESMRSHNTQIRVVPLPKAAAGNKVNPYRAMSRWRLAAHNQFTVLWRPKLPRRTTSSNFLELAGEPETPRREAPTF
jgi:hypothetical protein